MKYEKGVINNFLQKKLKEVGGELCVTPPNAQCPGSLPGKLWVIHHST